MTGGTGETGETGEAAWLAWCRRHGFPAARAGEESLRPMYQQMSADPGAIPVLTGRLGRLHAQLHACPADDAPGPVTDWVAAVDRLTALPAVEEDPELARQADWLRAHEPETTRPVACHGDYTPVTVHVDTADGSMAATSWQHATVADPEYDVAYAELGLWTASHLSPVRSERTMMQLTRGFLVNGYRGGYAGGGGVLDARRLAAWGAYHACVAGATVEQFLAPDGVGWSPAELAEARGNYRQDVAVRFDDLVATITETEVRP